MKLALTFFALLCSGLSLLAQPILDYAQWQLKTEHYDSLRGTRGLLLSCRYRPQTPPNQRVLVLPARLSLSYGQDTFFKQEEPWIAPLSGQDWQEARFFIPYRELALYGGQHEDLQLELLIGGKLAHHRQLSFVQPPRYELVLHLDYAQVKKLAKPWDKGHPRQAPPDIYHSLHSNGAAKPLAISQVLEDTWVFPPDSFRVHVLEGERLTWQFWDEDGAKDTRLALYDLGQVQGDAQRGREGIQQDHIRALAYRLKLQEIRQQPMTVYVRPDYRHQNRLGLLLEVDYALSGAWVGQAMKPRFQAFDLDQQPIALSQVALQALDHGDSLVLSRRGRSRYFLPFYAWNPNIRNLQYSLHPAQGLPLKATPCFVYNRYEPPSYLNEASLFIEENAEVQGLKGFWLGLAYTVNQLEGYGRLQLSWRDSRGQDLSPLLYALDNQGKLKRLGEGAQRHLDLKAADSLRVFLPYAYWDKGRVQLQARVAVDNYFLNLLQDSLLPNPPKGLDAPLGLLSQKQEEYRLDGHYGMVVEGLFSCPELLWGDYELQAQTWRNNQAHSDWFWREADSNRVLQGLNQKFALVFPHRYLGHGDSLRIEWRLKHRQTGAYLDSVWTWQGRAALLIYNTRFDLSLEQAQARADRENLRLSWRLGAQVLQRIDLPAKTRLSRQAAYQHQSQFLLHREDLLSLWLENPGQPDRLLWQGNESAWRKLKGKLQIPSDDDLKRLRIQAKIQPILPPKTED